MSTCQPSAANPHPLSLLLLKGHPATGKSALARGLARRLGWPLLDKDDVKDWTLDLPRGNELAYDITWQIVRTQLSLGVCVIVDTPLSYAVGYTTGLALAQSFNARLFVIETKLDENIWRERLEERARRGGESHRISGWDAMQALLDRYNGCWDYPIEPAHHIRVDTSRPLDECIHTVLRRIGIG